MKKIFLALLVLFVVSFAFSSVYVEDSYIVIKFKPNYYEEAEEVYLVGSSFDYVEMEPQEDGSWSIELDLEPGVYYYRFYVNDEEIIDPEAPAVMQKDGEQWGAFGVIKYDGTVLVVKPEEVDTAFLKLLPFGVSIYNGKVYFKFEDKNYKKVYISGNFVNWEKPPKAPLMKKMDGFWIYSMELKEGSYQYKYIVEDESGNQKWVADPQAPLLVDDGFGGKNSFFTVKKVNGEYVISAQKELKEKSQKSEELSIDEALLKEIPEGVSVKGGIVFFKIKDIGAEKAYLAGTFNSWAPHGHEMKRFGKYWVAWLKLNPGQYQYKYVFVVGGQDVWKEDPKAPGYVPDGYGGKNGIFNLVESDGTLKIEKPKTSAKKSGPKIVSGIFNFEYKMQKLSDNSFAPANNPTDFSLDLVITPSSNLALDIKYSGAELNYAVFSMESGNFYSVFSKGSKYNDFYCNTYDYIEVGYKPLAIAMGFNGEKLGYLAGIKINNFIADELEILYSNEFFTSGNSVFSKVSFDLPFNLYTTLQGIYAFDRSIYGAEFKIEREDNFFSLKYYSNNDIYIEGSIFGFYGHYYLYDSGKTDLEAKVPIFLVDDLKLYYERQDSKLVKTSSYGIAFEGSSFSSVLKYSIIEGAGAQYYMIFKGSVKF